MVNDFLKQLNDAVDKEAAVKLFLKNLKPDDLKNAIQSLRNAGSNIK